MANGAKKAKTANRNLTTGNAPAAKDDGTRWAVQCPDTGARLYRGSGVSRPEAERLAAGLLAPAVVVQIAE